MGVLRGLTGLRGLAALLVVLFHAYWRFLENNEYNEPFVGSDIVFAQYMWIGVDLFFVLSAFLLTIALSERKPTSYAGFVFARWKRIAPPYYAAILASAAVFFVFDGRTTRPDDVLVHLLFLHSTSSATLSSINPVFWTLGTEFQFYLLLPFVLPLFMGRHWAWGLAGAAAISLTVRALTYSLTWGWISWTLPAFLVHFAIGILAARLLLSKRLAHVNGAFIAGLGGLGLLVVFASLDNPAVYSQGHDTHLANVLVRPLLAVALAAVVLGICQSAGRLAAFFESRPLQTLGQVSYSLYLFHFLWLPILTAVPAMESLAFTPWMLATTILSIVSALAAYPLLERPFMSARQRRVVQSSAPAAPPMVPVPAVPAQA